MKRLGVESTRERRVDGRGSLLFEGAADWRPRTMRACDGRPRLIRRGIPRPAVFLDRDGTLIVDKPYNANPEQIEVFPDAAEAIRALNQAGYLLIVVTNQSGVARGLYDETAVSAMHARLDELLVPDDRPIQAYYFCPHHADGRVQDLAMPCRCRKPEPGMLLRAAEDWAVDLQRSWMIGDMETDVEAGWAAGCRSILLGRRRGARGGLRAASLREAVQIINERDAIEARFAVEGRRATRRD